MIEKFIERGTDFPLRNGKLSIYETNCICKGIQFYFDQYVITLMLSGHKTIVSENLKLEFFPGTIFMPEKETINEVSIPNASHDNPTKCLVLEVNPSYVQSVYEEVMFSKSDGHILNNEAIDSAPTHFLSNDQLLIQAFIKLYKLQSEDKSVVREIIEDLTIKELLYRLFNTQGVHLLRANFEKSIFNREIRKAIHLIKKDVQRKFTVASLASMTGLGQTTFYKQFKESTGRSPAEYVLHERIRQSKILINKGKYTLQEIAFKCGFNSYEYFCSQFKKIERKRPSEFRRATAV